MTIAFRDEVTETLAGIGAEFRLPATTVAQMRREIGQARAIRLDDHARKLIDHYMDGLNDHAAEDILASLRLPWPSMWMEFREEGGFEVGVLLSQDEKRLSCEFFEDARGTPHRRVYPPTIRIILERGAESFRIEATDVFRTMASVMGSDPALRRSLDDLVERNRVMGATNVARAAVLSVLLESRGILEVEDGAPVPRAVRRRAERAGLTLPPTPVSRINLGTLGRAEYAMCLEDGPTESDSSEEAQGQRRRRAHWVRGHMFMARNRQLTYRRPHIRGAGAVLDSVMAITAPEDDGPQP